MKKTINTSELWKTHCGRSNLQWFSSIPWGWSISFNYLVSLWVFMVRHKSPELLYQTLPFWGFITHFELIHRLTQLAPADTCQDYNFLSVKHENSKEDVLHRHQIASNRHDFQLRILTSNIFQLSAITVDDLWWQPCVAEAGSSSINQGVS